jgi:eukaryotic-like serine/threonine-protein kinase
VDTQVIAGRYRLERRLGAGGMSEVWAAEDLELDRTVAVKLLAPEADPTRFEREARAAAGLSHPNICALYDYGEDGRRRYMVLEYLPGGTLEERLAPGRPLTDSETGGIAREIAAGLAHAHDRGLVHRDLKPSNVLFDAEGRAKIADFGIVHMDAATGLTEAGTVMGTAAYISPEQAAGEPATPASDVYAFGVILFRMLTGRLPFEAPDALTVAAMHRDRQPPPVSEFRADAPPLLESLAMASLAKGPADRPADGRALLAELGRPAQPLDETAVTTRLAVPPPSKRKRTALIAIAVAVLAAAGVALAVGLGSDDSGPAPTASTSATASTSRPATTTSPVVTPPTSTGQTTSTEATTTATTAAATTTAPTTTVPPTTTTTPATTIAPPPTTTAATTTTTSADTTTPTSTTATDTTTTSPATTAAVTETAAPG